MNNVSGKKETECYGCGTCSLICPKNCIKLKENNRGFLMPCINEKECINCGLCAKKCPYNNCSDKHKISEVFAAKSKDDKVLFQSTSGGIFSEIAIEFLKLGVIVGAAYDEKLNVKHIIVDKIENLNRIIGSKYVQSNSFPIFPEIKKRLDKNEKILFSGTGCQIDGLKKYLNKNYDNLYTIEIACHGVPSPGFFRTYIRYFEKKENASVIDYKFRTKKDHKKGEHYKFHAITSDGRNISKYSNIDPYYGSFLDGLSLRETCYNCKYKGTERVGDILLADFWGVEKCIPKFDDARGCSCVFICSHNGQILFDLIKNKIDYAASSYEDATKYNRSIDEPAKKQNNSFFEKEKLTDNIDIINKIKIKNRAKKIIKNVIPEKIKRIIKRVG